MDNLGYLFAAFALAWALIFGYMLILGGRLSRISRDLDRDDHEDSEESQ